MNPDPVYTMFTCTAELVVGEAVYRPGLQVAG